MSEGFQFGRRRAQLARAARIYEEFLGNLGSKRDWLKEIEEEKKADRGRCPH